MHNPSILDIYTSYIVPSSSLENMKKWIIRNAIENDIKTLIDLAVLYDHQCYLLPSAYVKLYKAILLLCASNVFLQAYSILYLLRCVHSKVHAYEIHYFFAS